LLLSLNEEREKNNKLTQHLSAANRNNHELKSRVARSKVEVSTSEKEEFEMKINKYR
jgi:FtsZ-binding cell division protein ZapB